MGHRPIGLCQLLFSADCEFALTLQEQAEDEDMGDQQQRHDDGRDDVGGSQLSGLKRGVIALVEGVEEIGCAPEVEDPGDHRSDTGGQRQERQYCEYRRDEVSIGRRMGEGRWKFGRHDAGDEKYQSEETEAVQHEQRT